MRRLLFLLALALTAGQPAAAEDAAPPAAEEDLSARELIHQGILRGFEGDLDASDAIWTRLRARQPEHPAALVWSVHTLYWRQVYDNPVTTWDEAIEARSLEAIELADAMLARNPDDAEVHYYAGRAHFDLARLKGIRGSFLAAGTHGERGRTHLERALELDPETVDPRCPLGMYYYYAGRLPGIVKWMRWLWFVPVGETDTGIRYLNDVYRNGDLHRLDAQLALMDIHNNHDGEKHVAIELASDLHRRFPHNTLIHYEYLEALFAAGRYDALIESAIALESVDTGQARDAGRSRMARALRARAELHLGRPEVALEIVDVFGEDGPASPNWGHAWVLLTRAQARDALGEREKALALYARVIALEAPRRSRRAANRAHDGTARPFAPPTPPIIRAVPAEDA